MKTAIDYNHNQCQDSDRYRRNSNVHTRRHRKPSMWRRLRETIWLVPTGSQQERWNINLIDVLASSLVLMSEHYLLTSEEHDLFSDDLKFVCGRAAAGV